MTIKLVLQSFVLDEINPDVDQLVIPTEKAEWLNERNVAINTVSVYDISTMWYRVKIIAEFDNETYVEYRMVWG